MSKTAKVTFIASLVLNVLLLGVLLGQVPRVSAPPPGRQQRIEEELKKLPEPAQSRLRERFAEFRAAGEPARKQIDEIRAETLRLLAAEPFDAAAYDAQLRKMEDLRIRMIKSIGERIRQTVQELSADERRMLADLLRRPAPARE